jgi:RNA polymerase sigma-70 factor (ECF subfamily)
MKPREVRRYDEPGLVDLARDGDVKAFAELVRTYQNEVYTLALRVVADREMAADVAQDAFVRAWRAMSSFRGEARFSTWMYRITVNTAFTQRERAKKRRTDSLDDMHFEPEAAGPTPEQAGEAAGLRTELERAIVELPASLRVVVVLKDVYDWSHAEIADHLDISVTAAKVRLHRGRRQLREDLWPEGEAR